MVPEPYHRRLGFSWNIYLIDFSVIAILDPWRVRVLGQRLCSLAGDPDAPTMYGLIPGRIDQIYSAGSSISILEIRGVRLPSQGSSTGRSMNFLDKSRVLQAINSL